MLDWIPDFDVNIKRGHIILYVVITAGLLWIGNRVYDMGYEDGWYGACDWYESRIVQPLDEDFYPYTPEPMP